MRIAAVKRQLLQIRRLDPALYAGSIRTIRQAPHLAAVISAAGLKAIIARRENEAGQ